MSKAAYTHSPPGAKPGGLCADKKMPFSREHLRLGIEKPAVRELPAAGV